VRSLAGEYLPANLRGRLYRSHLRTKGRGFTHAPNQSIKKHVNQGFTGLLKPVEVIHDVNLVPQTRENTVRRS
jgi:hypothetical protein